MGTFENENLLCLTENEASDVAEVGEYGVLGDAGSDTLSTGYLAHSKAFLHNGSNIGCCNVK